MVADDFRPTSPWVEPPLELDFFFRCSQSSRTTLVCSNDWRMTGTAPLVSRSPPVFFVRIGDEVCVCI